MAEEKNYWVGKENQYSAEKLKAGETIILIGFGQSMVPILKSGQPALVAPVNDATALKKNDVVFAKVNGHFYLHKIAAVKNGNSYLISNNHGHANGWVSRNKIFGKMIPRL